MKRKSKMRNEFKIAAKKIAKRSKKIDLVPFSDEEMRELNEKMQDAKRELDRKLALSAEEAKHIHIP